MRACVEHGDAQAVCGDRVAVRARQSCDEPAQTPGRPMPRPARGLPMTRTRLAPPDGPQPF